MEKRRTKHNNWITGLILALLSVVLLFGCVVSFAPSVKANADTPKYSNVLEDLGKDASFSKNNYPDSSEDYSLQLIQIAESVDSALLVYVYQPSHSTKDLIATSIRLSTGINANAHWKDYPMVI